MFISRGENIQPEIIEKALLNISGVEEALVVPVPHVSHTHSIYAFIKHTKKTSPEDIRRAYQTNLPKYLWPEKIHPWLEKAGAGRELFRKFATQLTAER